MEKLKLPKYFKPILWSYNFAKIDVKKDKKTIIIQTINYGDWEHWQWINNAYKKDEIANIIKDSFVSEFRLPALKLASIIFGVKKINYASRSAYIKSQKTLG